MALLVAYIHWDVSPELVRIGPVAIRWYGVLFALLFWIGYSIVAWQFRLEGKDEQSLGSLLTHLVVGTIVGARLGHCVFYEPAYYLNNPVAIAKIWEGGLASHGGAAGVLIALYLYARKHPDQSYLWLLDRLAVPAALGASLIRVGNLFNSEILGRPATVPWAFVFERVDSVPRHPAQLYESIAYALIFCGLLGAYRRWRSQTPRGLLVGIFLVSVFTARFLLEFCKEEQAAYKQDTPWHVGQWLSLPFIVAGGVLIWRALRVWQPQRRETPS